MHILIDLINNITVSYNIYIYIYILLEGYLIFNIKQSDVCTK